MSLYNGWRDETQSFGDIPEAISSEVIFLSFTENTFIFQRVATQNLSPFLPKGTLLSLGD